MTAVADFRPVALRTCSLVDATGRAAWLARRLGAERVAFDRLVAVVTFFRTPPTQGNRDTCSMVEATEQGWWYSARVPDDRGVLAFMTDADLLPRGLRCHRRLPGAPDRAGQRESPAHCGLAPGAKPDAHHRRQRKSAGPGLGERLACRRRCSRVVRPPLRAGHRVRSGVGLPSCGDAPARACHAARMRRTPPGSSSRFVHTAKPMRASMARNGDGRIPCSGRGGGHTSPPPQTRSFSIGDAFRKRRNWRVPSVPRATLHGNSRRM